MTDPTEPHSLRAVMEQLAAAEAEREIVRGVVAEQAAVDGAITKRLADGWKINRLDSTLRALLRAGAWELMHRPDTPKEVVLDEYVELAKAFFDDRDARFVNAALDGVARDVRG